MEQLIIINPIKDLLNDSSITKEKILSVGTDLANAILENSDGIEGLVKCKTIVCVFETAEKHLRKQVNICSGDSVQGIQVSTMKAKTVYDFTNDDTWLKLQDKKTEIEKEIKDREEILKANYNMWLKWQVSNIGNQSEYENMIVNGEEIPLITATGGNEIPKLNFK